ncbi:unnamed protein product [Pleuronectes platessa]|uniref:Uncharacterized protein n=1 Tax=Pleuronectes platessa TaxID=8262 RepID=A0A9N7TZU5_PLEPL|nr:unnamed protein product [Pleuronectes platessa]
MLGATLVRVNINTPAAGPGVGGGSAACSGGKGRRLFFHADSRNNAAPGALHPRCKVQEPEEAEQSAVCFPQQCCPWCIIQPGIHPNCGEPQMSDMANQLL